mmetsp:Transcript_1800/g.5403  ORF Transcript_1800/g.5403 Transcript_1800/m.5403 type:complete len:282 (+) Transcript_1800:188-1033(+)
MELVDLRLGGGSHRCLHTDGPADQYDDRVWIWHDSAPQAVEGQQRHATPTAHPLADLADNATSDLEHLRVAQAVARHEVRAGLECATDEALAVGEHVLHVGPREEHLRDAPGHQQRHVVGGRTAKTLHEPRPGRRAAAHGREELPQHRQREEHARATDIGLQAPLRQVRHEEKCSRGLEAVRKHRAEVAPVPVEGPLLYGPKAKVLHDAPRGEPEGPGVREPTLAPVRQRRKGQERKGAGQECAEAPPPPAQEQPQHRQGQGPHDVGHEAANQLQGAHSAA